MAVFFVNLLKHIWFEISYKYQIPKMSVSMPKGQFSEHVWCSKCLCICSYHLGFSAVREVSCTIWQCSWRSPCSDGYRGSDQSVGFCQMWTATQSLGRAGLGMKYSGLYPGQLALCESFGSYQHWRSFGFLVTLVILAPLGNIFTFIKIGIYPKEKTKCM